jgi:hypothetical protein
MTVRKERRSVLDMRSGGVRASITIGALVATGLLAGACQMVPQGRTVEGMTIDGWRIGERITCSRDDYYDCDELADLAATQLDRMAPGHPGTKATALFHEVLRPGTARSGTMRIVVFELENESMRAIGVYCGVGGCWAGFDPP